MIDGVAESLRTASEDLGDRYFDRLWQSRGAECEVWPARRIDRKRRVVVEGIELIGFDTGDDQEWPGYFEPVRERNWFSRDWRRVQSVDAAVGAIEEHLRRWVGADP
ncbi:MAG TPA: hypothetical protein VGV93_07065 [Acidimicrobiales bacterium]|nr:hypothetical protein [Acidimicrobiales bacterium]